MSCRDQRHEQILSMMQKLLLLEDNRLSGVRQLRLVLIDLLRQLDVGGEQSRAFSGEITCIRDALTDSNDLASNERKLSDLHSELRQMVADNGNSPR